MVLFLAGAPTPMLSLAPLPSSFSFLFLLPPIFLFLYLSFLYLSLPFLSLSLYSLFPFLISPSYISLCSLPLSLLLISISSLPLSFSLFPLSLPLYLLLISSSISSLPLSLLLISFCSLPLSLPFLSLSLYSLFPFLYLSFVNYRSSLSFSPFSRPFSNSFFFPPLADNSLYIWGCCNNGQLGSNTTKALTPLLLQLAETKQFVLFPSLSLSISFSLPPSPFPSVPFSPLLSNSPSFLPSPIYLLPFLLHASPCPYMSLCLQIPGARIGRTKQKWKFFSFQFSWEKRAIKIRKFRKWKPGRQKDAAGIRAGKRF